MADIVDSKTRSRMMSGIKGKNTKPEMLVRRHLHRKGLRFRLHRKDLPGKPDLIFPGRMIALFVHGCFWHRHEGCPKATTPSTNSRFWEKKFSGNVSRDKRVKDELEQLGWKVLVIWECQLSTEKLDELADVIMKRAADK
ncbi:very short patch repair endonuclease [Pseudodesulfovibrio indicus]|uniref:very short patch repair endonuclease n=1 Tax=Pseudodesulfovibrio indicus TaxID=1716143 RepID=UPI002931CA1E|nr:very short patch repair endonuclease [Pseudodesulfovibrio indicus]